MKKIKILFQGDSITDAGRDRSDAHNLAGYSVYTAEKLKENLPEVEFEFINLGISGNRTSDLLDRFQTDFIDVKADIVTLLIGINDVWRRFDHNLYTSPEDFRERFFEIVKGIKDTGAKLVVMEPFLLPSLNKRHFRTDLALITDEIRDIAVEYADAYIPLDGILAKARMTVPAEQLSEDGVHPAPAAQYVIGINLAEEIKKII